MHSITRRTTLAAAAAGLIASRVRAAEPVRATVVAKPAAPAPVVTARADDRDDDSAGAPPLPGHRPGHGGTTATDQQAQRSVALADRHNGLPPGWYVPVAYTR